MGNTEGKIKNQDEEVLEDISSQCQLSLEELKTEYEEWLVKYPTGAIEEREFTKKFPKILPKYSKEDLKKVSHHVFRVYDNDSNNQISFKERHDYLILNKTQHRGCSKHEDREGI